MTVRRNRRPTSIPTAAKDAQLSLWDPGNEPAAAPTPGRASSPTAPFPPSLLGLRQQRPDLGNGPAAPAAAALFVLPGAGLPVGTEPLAAARPWGGPLRP